MNSPLVSFRSARALLAGATGLLSILNANAQPAEADRIVELPQFVVTDTRELPPPESWRYAEIPGFEILSNASDRESQRLIRDFDLFRRALGVVWPVPQRAQRPTMLILCGRRAAFDLFVTRETGSVEQVSASRFLRNPEHSAIILDLEAKVLDIRPDDVGTDPTGSTDFSQISIEHNKQLYREYLYHLLGSASPRAPAWFEEGLAQLVMAMKFSENTITFGKLEDPNTVSASAAAVAGVNAAGGEADPDLTPLAGAPAEDRDFNVALVRRALVPLGAFFALPHGAPETRNPLGNNRWAKQAYAFVHMCLYGRGGRYRQAFATFLSRTSRGQEPTEALFVECFKMNFKTMEAELRGYIQFTDYTHHESRAKKGEGLAPAAAVEFREATQAEIGRIKGEALILAEKPNEARMALIAPYVRGERDPELLASLGLLERAEGKDERARKLLEAAVMAEPVSRARVHFELARLRFAEAAAAPGAGQKLSAQQGKSVLGPLLIARTQPPVLVAVYEMMADVWLASDLQPEKEQVGMLMEGARQFPRRSSLTYKAALVCAQNGFREEARALVEYGRGNATTQEVVKQFDEIRSSLGTSDTPTSGSRP